MLPEDQHPDDDPEAAFIPLEVPVPPQLAEACGYPGAARYVRLFWEPSGDEVIYDDGQRSGTGDPWVFLTYRRHPAVAPHLEPYNLGSSDFRAEHCLLIDRESNRASIAPIAAGRAFVRDQHPPPPDLSPYEQEEQARECEDMLKARDAGWQEVHVDPAVIRRQMEQQRRRIAEMIAFLNQRIPPPQDGA